MMGISSLRYLEDPDKRDSFDYAHYQMHLDVVQAIKAQLGIVIDMPPLHPVAEDKVAWSNAHQRLHDAINKALSTAGKDLTEHVFSHEWTNQNYMEHAAMNQVLGL